MRKSGLRKLLVPGIVMFLVFVVNGIASAQTKGPTPDDLATATNIMWTFITGFLVFFMQAGFALVETGFTRSKNVAHTMMMNMMVFCIGALGYWLVGFAFQFGGVNFNFPGNREDRGVQLWAVDPRRPRRSPRHLCHAIRSDRASSAGTGSCS